MLNKLGRLGCVLAMIAMIDGYSIMFQCYAWATMLYDRVPEQGVEEAIESTFSGEAPCPKCIALKQAKNAEKKKEPSAPVAPEFSPMAKFIPNSIEKLHLYKPAHQRLAYNQTSSIKPVEIFHSTDVPPPDFC